MAFQDNNAPFRIPGVTDTELDPTVYGPNYAKTDDLKLKYNVDSLSYPEDLFAEGDANRYGNNYVVFYINVAEDSRLVSRGAPTVINSEVPARERGSFVGKQFDVGTIATAGAAAIGTIGVISSLFSRSALETATKAVGGGAIVGASPIIGNAIENILPFDLQRQQKRLKKAIALHVPNNLNIQYSTQWQDVDTFIAQAAGTVGSRVGEIATALTSAEGASAWNSTKQGAGDVGSIVGNIVLGNTGAIGEAIQVGAGIAPNPKKEQMFKNVNFRQFSFEYTFSPRSKTEALAVQKIIKEFKYHMHPEFKDEGGFLYIYPSEFDISYYHNGQENPTLHKHTSCVLTDLRVNYTPNGMFNTFEGGMPTQINVSMQFLELAILTKDEIDRGF